MIKLVRPVSTVYNVKRAQLVSNLVKLSAYSVPLMNLFKMTSVLIVALIVYIATQDQINASFVQVVQSSNRMEHANASLASS